MGLFGKKKRTDNEYIMIDVKPLIDWDEPNGEGCIVSDMITKEGWKVGYMCREVPISNQPDSGWRFFQGQESQECCEDASRHHVFAINTVCNYDPDIVAYLHLPVGTQLVRIPGGKFVEDDGSQPICAEKQ